MAGKYDKMSFGKAFAAARKAHGGDGGKFSWKGKSYTTNTKKKTAAPAKSLRPKTRPGLPKDEKIKVTKLPLLAKKGETSIGTIKEKTSKALTKASKKPKMFASSSTSAKPAKKAPVKKAPVKKGILAYDWREWDALSKSERKKRDLPPVLTGGIVQFKFQQQMERNKNRKNANKTNNTKKTPKITNKSKTESRADKARKIEKANKKRQAQKLEDLKQAKR